ncbi:aromatic-ring hydroxylase C-terminal domain-containing protein [Nonomuraea sp. NPDC003214]
MVALLTGTRAPDRGGIPYRLPAGFAGIRAVLVRPDGYIAWASAGPGPADSLTATLAPPTGREHGSAGHHDIPTTYR